mmetsp:Transcript_14451/g.31415  ORF Transcript_14451/g.31415 Transcript_14451/m.31415 type:complete len:347 (+) Transcript_14451:284-1324(+)
MRSGPPAAQAPNISERGEGRDRRLVSAPGMPPLGGKPDAAQNTEKGERSLYVQVCQTARGLGNDEAPHGRCSDQDLVGLRHGPGPARIGVVPAVGALVHRPQAKAAVHHRPDAVPLRGRRHLREVLRRGVLGVEVHAHEDLLAQLLRALHLDDPLVLGVGFGLEGLLELHDRVGDDPVPGDGRPPALEVARLLGHDAELQGAGVGAAEAGDGEVVPDGQAVYDLLGADARRTRHAHGLRVVVHGQLVERAGHVADVEASLHVLALDGRVVRALAQQRARLLPRGRGVPGGRVQDAEGPGGGQRHAARGRGPGEGEPRRHASRRRLPAGRRFGGGWGRLGGRGQAGP